MTESAIKHTAGRRGRPPTIEPAELVRVALRLFERRGFEAVTMREIATAAGVSQRTLFRLFPTKSDLVWEGLHEIRAFMEAQAASLRGSGRSPAELLYAIAEPYLRPLEDPSTAKLVRRRLLLIAQAPALLNHPALREIEALFASLFPPALAQPSLVARSVVAMAFAAVFWWAEQNSSVTALEALRVAIHGVSASSGPESTSATTAGDVHRMRRRKG